MDRSVQEWIAYLEKNAISSRHGGIREFEIGRSIQYLATDTICRLCFGKPFGFISNHADCFDFLRTLEERLPIVEKFSIYTEVSRLLSFISYIPWLRRVLPSALDRKGIGKIMGVSHKVHLPKICY